jgi:hypothetical protein
MSYQAAAFHKHKRQKEEKHKQRELRNFASSTEDLKEMKGNQKSCIPTIQ